MAESLKRVKTRIRSVESVGKLTRAMEMISVSKLRLLRKDLYSSKEYILRAEMMVNNLAASFHDIHHELLEPRPKKRRMLLCPITSDTGLCGNYNNAVIHHAEEFIRKNRDKEISLITIGRKGFSHFRKSQLPVIDSYTELYGRYSSAAGDRITKSLVEAFTSGKADEVYVAYTIFGSSSHHAQVVEKVLNVEPRGGMRVEYLVEPDINSILNELMPLYISQKVKNILLNAFTAEHSTRVTAMSEATKNAGELLEDLVLLKNKMRQARITTEIIEVISSVEALKG